ncbi:MAG: hypothetical protein NTW67_02170 [Candidatus Woesearchaeota archaeon]|nr:hypothetical protein [Candidatus Woesearchaeota archaeon]
MRSTLGLVAIALLSFPILLMLIVTQQGASYLGTVVNVFNIVLALCAALGCWFAYKMTGKCFPREKKGWFFVALAFFLFTIGELLWAVFEFKGIETPIGSLADLFWTLGYFTLIFGFYVFLSMMFFSSESYNYVIMALSALVGGFVAYLGIPGDIAAELTLGHFVQHFYIFLDFILLGMVLVLIIPLWRVRNRLFVTWLVFALGIAVWIVFDFLFAGMTAFGVYYSGHPVDILYAFAYVLFIFAADSKVKLVEHGMCLPVKVSRYA